MKRILHALLLVVPIQTVPALASDDAVLQREIYQHYRCEAFQQRGEHRFAEEADCVGQQERLTVQILEEVSFAEFQALSAVEQDRLSQKAFQMFKKWEANNPASFKALQAKLALELL